MCSGPPTWRCIQRVINIVSTPGRETPVIGTVLREENKKTMDHYRQQCSDLKKMMNMKH